MNYLITGSSGFIGTHLIQTLLKQDHTVTLVPRAMLYDPTQLTTFAKNARPDYIINLASYGNMSHQKDIHKIFRANLEATFNILSTTLDIPYKGFIQVGSSSEYGDRLTEMVETDLPRGTSMYAATKVGATYLAQSFARTFDKPIAIIRPFSVYGPGEASFRFIPSIMRHLSNGTQMPVVSHPQHDWIYIDDFIDGLLTVADNMTKLTGYVVNIGTGRAYRNYEIIQKLEDISGRKLSQQEVYEDTNASTRWIADNTLLRSFGWNPVISLEDGLQRCWHHYETTQ